MTMSEQMARIAERLELSAGEIRPDADGRKALARAGWDVKGGTLYADVGGTGVPLWPERAIFGPPNDLQRFALVSLQPGYKSAIAKYCTAFARMRVDSMARAQLDGFEQKALSEGSDPAGGFLVPADVMAEVYARVAAVAVVRPFANVVPIASDILKIPSAQPSTATAGGLSSGADSIFASGFVGSWAGELPTFSDTDPAFGTFQIPVKKIRVGTKLSSDFVADSAIDVLAWLAFNGGKNIALIEDQGFLTGDGTALKPSGIVNAGITTTDLAGTTAHMISNTVSSLGSASKIKDLCYALPSQYARDARWIWRRATEGKVRKLIDFQSRYLFDEEEEGTLLSKPLDNSDFVDADGTANNNVAIFGDFGGYTIAQRSLVSVRLVERFADTGQIGFILTDRVGGDVFDKNAFRIGTVS